MKVPMPRVDFAPFLLDEGVVIGEDPTVRQLAVARQISARRKKRQFEVERRASIS